MESASREDHGGYASQFAHYSEGTKVLHCIRGEMPLAALEQIAESLTTVRAVPGRQCGRHRHWGCRTALAVSCQVWADAVRILD